MKRKIRHRIKFTALAAALAVLLMAGTAVTAVMDGFDGFMKRAGPAFGELANPVGLYTVYDGIRMEVIGARNFGSHAIAFVSLQDISGANRINKDGLKYRSVFIEALDAQGNGIGEKDTMLGGVFEAGLIYFDETANKAFYEVRLWNGDIVAAAHKIRVGLRAITLDHAHYFGVPVNVDLSGLGEAQTMTFPVDADSIWGLTMEDVNERFGDETMLVEILTPGENLITLPHGRSGQWISNIGVVDGRLHVQTVHDNTAGLRFPSFALGYNGDEIHGFTIALYADEEHEFVSFPEPGDPDTWIRPRFRYFNDIFEIDIARLSEYTLLFYWSHDIFLEGDWQVTALVDDVGAQVLIRWGDMVISGVTVENFMFTPLGLHMTGNFENRGYETWNITLETTEGSLELGRGSGWVNHSWRRAGMLWRSGEPLDVSTVTALLVGGERIEVRD